ncbi:MAG: aspartate-semialdehyde dehydrogenase [Planctomycetales bacterium]|nr:aspartate-semialdehyde dehydrogenase [Planctomycetales bacterium]
MFQCVGIVGATGAVGRIMLQLLTERNFAAREFRFLASKRSAGSKLNFRGQAYTIEELRPEAFAGCDLVIASTPDDVAAEFLPAAIKAGCTVIDESGYWRMHPDVALVIPEVNPQAAINAKGIIASPNCSATPVVMAAKPLHDAARVTRLIVTTFQAVSGVGLSGTTELLAGTQASLDEQDYDYQSFAHPIAFNAIPQIGSFKEDGYTSEELKVVNETKKILGDDSIKINATCVRIPVPNCHCVSITAETERPVSPDEARRLFAAFPGLVVVDDPSQGRYPMPINCTGRDEVFIGRIRRDLSNPNGLCFWAVLDNVRKGAATNAVQIAELLAKHRFGK